MSKKRPDALKKAFGQRVRGLRKAAGMSQMALGEKAGLDHTYVGGVERAERNLSLEAIAKLANGLGVEVEDLFRYSGRKSRIVDESLSRLVALLEREDTATKEMALDLVRAALRWKSRS